MIRIPKELIHSIRRHAQRTYAEEACGVLYGRRRGGKTEVLGLRELDNRRNGERHRRFLITPEDYREAEREAAARGLELIGSYHSHPDHPAVPSAYDLSHAWPFFSYVIVSVDRGEPGQVRSFVMVEDRSGFTEEVVEGR